VVAGRRVHDHARGLVQHDYVVILVDDIERDRLSRGVRDVSLRDLELDDIPYPHAVGGIGGPAVDEHEVALDQPRCSGAAEVVGMLGEKAIQPRGGGGRDQLTGFRNR
jgi:hypothetical protein